MTVPPDYEKKTFFQRFQEWRHDPYRERAGWTDKAVVLLTVGIVILAAMQWKEMHDSGTQTDKIIAADNLIEQHQRQLVVDNKQTLQDNRDALKAVLGENRDEVSSILRENRNALTAQTKAAHDQANAALQAAIAIQGQTEISERPWLSVEPSPIWLNYLDSPPGKQATLVLRLSIKNVGKSIAKDIQIDAKMFPTEAGVGVAPDAMENQRQLCDHPAPAPIGKFALFPADQPTEREIDISAGASSIEAKAAFSIGGNPRKFVGFYVVGCISYHFSFGTKIHQTLFAYHLIGQPPMTADGKPFILSDGAPVIMGFEVGVEVKKEKLGMLQELFAKNDAN